MEKPIKVEASMEISVELTANEWSHVLTGLDELPRRISNPLIERINNQMFKAIKDANGPKEEVDEGSKEEPKD